MNIKFKTQRIAVISTEDDDEVGYMSAEQEKPYFEATAAINLYSEDLIAIANELDRLEVEGKK